MGGGIFHLRNPDGRGVIEVWKSRWEGGGVKNVAICEWGVDFSGITHLLLGIPCGNIPFFFVSSVQLNIINDLIL